VDILTFSIIIGVGFITALLVGAGLAKLIGFKLNEPEYYDLQDRLTKRNKDDKQK